VDGRKEEGRTWGARAIWKFEKGTPHEARKYCQQTRAAGEETSALSEAKDAVEIEEDPRICGLMMEAEPITEEIDFIVNNAFPNHPKMVALWKKNMGDRSGRRVEAARRAS
jgi:hypothetical protein